MTETIEAILISAMLVTCVLYGCGSAYPECHTAGEYRCAGTMLETCDGEAWVPMYDCSLITIDDDPMPLECGVIPGQGERCR